MKDKPSLPHRLVSLYSLCRLLSIGLPMSASLLILFGEESVTARLFQGWLGMAYLFMIGPILILFDWVWTVLLYKKPMRELTILGLSFCSLYNLSISFLMITVLEYTGALIWTYAYFGVLTSLLSIRLGQPFDKKFLSNHDTDRT